MFCRSRSEGIMFTGVCLSFCPQGSWVVGRDGGGGVYTSMQYGRHSVVIPACNGAGIGWCVYQHAIGQA